VTIDLAPRARARSRVGGDRAAARAKALRAWASAGDNPGMLEPALTHTPAPASEAELDEYLSRPAGFLVERLAAVPGDLLVLGAGGKMGWSLAAMARRAFDAAGQHGRRVVAVSRFADASARDPFEQAGIATIASDLMADGALDGLPEAPNVLFLAGMKFGSTGNEPATWAMNTFLPGLVARRYAASRIVALSTGNVYALTAPSHGGSREEDPIAPVGEYAITCLGRERLFTYESEQRGTAVALIRLNYANALRYGVLTDIGRRVQAGQPVDVTMGFVNVIWQGDSNAATLAAFGLASSPPAVLNVAGPEIASVRSIATRFAELLGSAPPSFTGSEAETALLNNGGRSHRLLGPPSVPLDRLMAWTAEWLQRGGRLLNKPTGFESRDGRF
jgi:dTDP-4-dehydrorhamnose reductase